MRHVRDVRHVVVLVVCVAIGGTAAAGGGYFPTAWGWTALGPAAVAAAALLVQDDLRTTPAGAAFALLLASLVAWTAVSLLWTDSVPRTVAEVERDLVYVAVVGAVLVLPKSRLSLTAGLAGVLAGVCCAGLATRLFPGRYGLDVDTAYRLARPLGYWNAMGAVAAMGTILALGVAADARLRTLRALVSAAPLAFLPTLVFSASRGGAIALAAGIVVALALHPRRRRLALTVAAIGVPAAVAAALAASSHELTEAPSSLAAAGSDGRRLAIELFVLALLALAAPFAVDAVAPRLPRLPRLPPRSAAAVAAVAIAAGVVGAVAFGGQAYDAFRTPSQFGETGLRAHLFSLSGHERSTYWRVALDEYRDHRALGSGAGTFDLYWTRDRPLGVGARDAHSLYVETLAELGPVGLVLLLGALAAPFFAVGAARRHPLVPALAGAYAAFLVHAAADWDWELPTVTLAALICGGAISGSNEPTLMTRGRPLLVALAAGVAACAVVVQHGNDATAKADEELRAGRPAQALQAAHDASRWAPWAADPWRVRADAERTLGRLDAARRSARKGIAKDPRDWIGWFQLAYLTTGGEHEAAETRVRTLNPLAPP
jgi:O-antigen ligase